jgi:hypothetical protein
MSFYSDASLIVIPSGYKASKVYSAVPTDGTGDLAFTRSNDTATRVAENGLIQKVRTNLVLQSNTFNTTWTASNASVTSGQAGYDGTNNAWLLSKSAASGYISQGPASSGSETISVYAKAGTDNWLYILVRDSASVFFGGYFDLQNGVVGSATGATTLKIESVGNGWYRCSASFVKSTSTYYRIYPAEGNNDTSGTSGNILIQASQLEAGDVATNYIPTTTTAVSVGPVANVPRLDYLNSSCPRLLLEPQRTNLLTFSEQFDNAAWIKDASTATANAAISPDGYTNADKLFETATTDFHRVYGPTISVTSGTTYTASIFVKAAEVTTFAMELRLTSNVADATFNLVAGTVSGSGVIQDYGNGWYRCIVTGTATATGGGRPMFFIKQRSSYAGNASNGLLIYGAQFEAGAYATSYIPTLAAAVTRGADACSKTGISSLIGQQEGVVYWQGILPKASSNGAASASNVFSTERTNIKTAIVMTHVASTSTLSVFFVSNGTSLVALTATSLAAGSFAKIAFAYKSGSFALFVNGVLRASSALTFTSITTMAEINLNDNVVYYGYTTQQFVEQLLLFPTRLPNSELASLTTL